jgi:hypothetical protein
VSWWTSAFFYLLPYWLLLATFIWTIWRGDKLVAVTFTLYAAYQLYAAAWAWTLWRLNEVKADSAS